MSATAQADKVSLIYARQACVNLEQLFAAWGDLESVRHFQQRQRSLRTATTKATSHRKSSIVNPK